MHAHTQDYKTVVFLPLVPQGHLLQLNMQVKADQIPSNVRISIKTTINN